MAKRQTVLGLPIGKKRRRSPVPKMIAGGAALAAVPAVVVPTVTKVSRTFNKGRQVAEQATDILDTATSVKQAVSQKKSTFGKIRAVISEAKKIGGDKDGGRPPKLSHLIEQHTNVAVPRRVAYDQWTQFEAFPSFMKGVESVEQQEPDKTRWVSKIGPSRRNWQAEITEQVPDERIRWKSTGGAKQQGVATFHELDEELTRMLIQMEYRPTGVFEWTAKTLRVPRRRVKRDLRLFKHFIELRGEETGAWRGTIAKKDDQQAKKDDQNERGEVAPKAS
jgi:uncharacterized membrane protein